MNQYSKDQMVKTLLEEKLEVERYLLNSTFAFFTDIITPKIEQEKEEFSFTPFRLLNADYKRVLQLAGVKTDYGQYIPTMFKNNDIRYFLEPSTHKKTFFQISVLENILEIYNLTLKKELLYDPIPGHVPKLKICQNSIKVLAENDRSFQKKIGKMID